MTKGISHRRFKKNFIFPESYMNKIKEYFKVLYIRNIRIYVYYMWKYAFSLSTNHLNIVTFITEFHNCSKKVYDILYTGRGFKIRVI